ncbi:MULTISPECIES: hypothetical protein [Curtobacterium]|uniref:DUF3558 domain-containing protein n=1 Tax=Curtobacterium poinsettiae TaxID=159612 RepID=A0ABT3S1M1_9MICO|nr:MULTISPECIES: hypothetical protein [Curtobacterium]MBT1611028.1 hypothetical protein [Curtobacterium flaccumfaciens pv. poinsettiae]MCS6563991.1 hypothetical protein [Curtobacterium flaccumfaciens pv. flaccumfaciens]MCX2848711.1 hypothetical protein [Curtobacterium flaccumfaciens pv. poinsettiae]UXN19289.1 hypothetical protein N8D78_04030 [Curtobacterium flaccumfaciens pv. poinsettiae]UXZ58127.1 hypothetical protein MXD64_01730 [Curtobacterium sp. Arg-1]
MRHTIVLTALVAASLAMTGCAQAGPAGPAGPASATATSAADPTTAPSPDPTSSEDADVDDDTATVPASCTDLITPGKWDEAFASAPLNDPSVVGDPIAIPKSSFTPALQGDGKRLYCVWREPQADTSYLSIAVDAVDPAAARDALEQLATKGYDCDDESDGFLCQKVSKNSQYPVTDGDTYFARGDIGIHIQQSNIETTDLLDDVVAHVFTD